MFFWSVVCLQLSQHFNQKTTLIGKILLQNARINTNIIFQTCAREWSASGVQGARLESVFVPPTVATQLVSTCLSLSVPLTWWPSLTSANFNVHPATNLPVFRDLL
jgi:hypothetical protein